MAGRVCCPSPPWLVGLRLSHSAQPQHRAQSLGGGEGREGEGGEGWWEGNIREERKERTARSKRDESAEKKGKETGG